MRADLEDDVPVPVRVGIRRNPARLPATRRQNPGEQEVFEAFVRQAEGPDVPAKPVERDGMRRNPAPAGFGAREGLILYLNGLGTSDGPDDGPQGDGVHTAGRSRGCIVGWQIGNPDVVAVHDVIGQGS